VDLTISPSNTEFEGFIDYGSDITNRSEIDVGFDLDFGFIKSNTSFVVDNPIPQPVFRKSGINTSVTVWDGNTVVLGGLMSEKITDIQDKVPVIGDIPLVGRLWQSKVKQTTKKCVLMFVTVKVIDPGGQRINLPAADPAASVSACP
jgi:general secretion pathway protein D